MPKCDWLKKLIVGGKTTIVPLDVGLSCKTYFRTRYALRLNAISKPTIEQEPELKKQSAANFFTEFREL